MAPSRWDDEEEDSTPPSSPPQPVIARRSKFDDEEDDSDVIDSWDKADDSETEQKKIAEAAAAKARAEAEAAKNKKSKSQRIEERRMENMRRRAAEEDSESSEDEDESEKRQRLRKEEKDADIKHAEDLFGGIGVKDRSAPKPVTLSDPSDPTKTVELSSLQLFNPQTRDQFKQLDETMVPLIAGQNNKKAQYPNFVTEFVKQLVKDMDSTDIKKISSALTTISNEKLREEKAAEKGGKKSKAAKNKTTLNAARDTTLKADTTAYDDGLDEDDFM